MVGGGPAGSATALLCARRGMKVLLLERARHPRPKPCGEGLLPHGVEWLRRQALTIEGRPFRAIRYVFPDGLEVGGAFPHGAGLGVRRTAFDPALVSAAAAAGADVREGIEVTGLQGQAVVAGGEPVEGRLIIAADGLHSRLRRWAGLDLAPAGRPRYGVTAHFAQRSEAGPEVRVYLASDHEVYTTPLDGGELLVALLAERGRMAALKGRLAAGYEEALREHPQLAERLGPRLDGPLAVGPLNLRARRRWAPGLLLVGDAAGFLDPITGEGMALALEQAELAARAAADWLSGDNRALSRYGARSEALGRELGWLTAALLFLVRRPPLARRVARNLRGHPGTFGQLLDVSARRRRLLPLLPRAILHGLVG